jgi:hypothetical protein
MHTDVSVKNPMRDLASSPYEPGHAKISSFTS